MIFVFPLLYSNWNINRLHDFSLLNNLLAALTNFSETIDDSISIASTNISNIVSFLKFSCSLTNESFLFKSSFSFLIFSIWMRVNFCLAWWSRNLLFFCLLFCYWSFCLLLFLWSLFRLWCNSRDFICRGIFFCKLLFPFFVLILLKK